MPLTPLVAAAAVLLGQASAPTPIHAYRDQAVWSAAGKLVHAGPDGVRETPVASAPFDISRGPSGKVTVVVAGRDGIYRVDLTTGARELLVRTRDPESPVLWGNRLAWIQGSRSIYTATVGGRPRSVPLPVRGATLAELDLFGGRLAISLATRRSEGDVQVWLQQLNGSRRTLVRKVTSGEAGRNVAGLAFDGGALYFAQVCSGDPSGCPGHGIAYRYGGGRLTRASVPVDLAGFAQARGESYWVTQNYGDCVDEEAEAAPCSVERERLTFRP